MNDPAIREAEMLRRPEGIVAEAAVTAGGAIERAVRTQFAMGSAANRPAGGGGGGSGGYPRRGTGGSSSPPRARSRSRSPSADGGRGAAEGDQPNNNNNGGGGGGGDDPDWLVPQLGAAVAAYRWAIANALPGPDRAAFVSQSTSALQRLTLLASRVEFARADSRLAEGERRVASGDFAGAAVVAAGVGKLYQEMELDPRQGSVPI